MRKKTTSLRLDTRTLALGGICVALSFLLSYIKIMELPQGGSVTLFSMLPLALFSFIFGPIAGLVASIAYGFLQFFQAPYVAHWISIFLDYPFAFGCLALTGVVPAIINKLDTDNQLLKNVVFQFVLGIVLAIFGRFMMHVLSGAIFFGMYAPEGMNPWVYSIVYNSSYLSIELITTLMGGIAIIKTPIYRALKC